MAATAAADAGDLLPDLDTSLSTPYATGSGGRIYLTFTARIANVGPGPLVLRGSRPSTSQSTMTVDQVVRRVDGSERTVAGVSTFEYDTGYARWGFTNYLRYELRRTDGSVVSTGPVIGFCVMDWVNMPGTLPGEPTSSQFRTCGGSRPSLLQLEEGISVGWANQHDSGRKGQLVEVSRTLSPSGNYVLVHTANPSGNLTEASTANNASSSLLQITWTTGRTAPTVRQLKSCPDSATCAL